MSLNGRELKELWQAPMTMEHSSPGCIFSLCRYFSNAIGTFLSLFFVERHKVMGIDSYLKMAHCKQDPSMLLSVPCILFLSIPAIICHFQALGKAKCFSTT